MAGTDADDEVRATVIELLDAQNAGDSERYGSLLSHRADAVHIGTDSEEWWTTKELVAALTGVVPEITVSIDDMTTHTVGDVAWVEGLGRFRSPDGQQRAVRATCVLVREDGRWKVAQQHASIAVPNDQLFG